MRTLVEATLAKVDHFMDRIHGVRRGRLIADDTAAALDVIRDHFQARRAELENLNTSASGTADHVKANHCDLVLHDLFEYSPYVGFLHHSQHTSNPFEVHGPLKRLARETIDSDVRLIISSEWEYSPFTYPQMGLFRDFVLLGLPASESENAFLLPMAGHEFGHPVWSRRQLDRTLRSDLNNALYNAMRARLQEVWAELRFPDGHDEAELRTDERATRWWEPALSSAAYQCEEIFCDLLGLWVFGTSYGLALAHLLAPGTCLSHPDYPPLRVRATILVEAAARFGVSMPTGFVDQFPEAPGAQDPDLLGEICAVAVREIVPRLIQEVEQYAAEKALRGPTAEGRQLAASALTLATPVSSGATLPEVLCAAWELRLGGNLWQSLSHLVPDRDRMLNDLVLKSAETMEYWHLTSGSP